MSRVAKSPVQIPKGVEVTLAEGEVAVKGPKGELRWRVHEAVEVSIGDGEVRFAARNGHPQGWALAGTTRALVANMVRGVSEGFERRLQLVGVGYRAQAQGKVLNLTLGFSHPVAFAVPEGITIETPSPTEIVVRGVDKQQVGQVAARIRAYRPPEPYKGKGIRYADEVIVRKEAKKK
ncbi:50S ribosomal protein L6 [Inmirania thermothiophila]|uniref:Large ribosomal subunit protein uL6 n=1 Tax=Inmirania thermothiophila TaxID=1750597 RepID=A0A3N1Y7P1_9GAMM|nr:50S ribosomal protein L6 [Inmirania thermothiophila]ROR34839.1 LSU ribosomal protein L6P [Inmirania thermothiophila]